MLIDPSVRIAAERRVEPLPLHDLRHIVVCVVLRILTQDHHVIRDLLEIHVTVDKLELRNICFIFCIYFQECFSIKITDLKILPDDVDLLVEDIVPVCSVCLLRQGIILALGRPQIQVVPVVPVICLHREDQAAVQQHQDPRLPHHP